MSTYTKNAFSEQTDGTGIQVDGVTNIHTSVSNGFDEVWLWASNSSFTDVVLTITYGTGTIVGTIPALSGLFSIIPGMVLSDGNTITAEADADDAVWIFGFVNTIT